MKHWPYTVLRLQLTIMEGRASPVSSSNSTGLERSAITRHVTANATNYHAKNALDHVAVTDKLATFSNLVRALEDFYISVTLAVLVSC